MAGVEPIPQGSCWRLVLPAGQKKPAWHWPLHAAVVSPDVAPKVPAGQAAERPPAQNVPGVHCCWASRVAMVPPVVKWPEETTSGELEPAGQYRVGLSASVSPLPH